MFTIEEFKAKKEQINEQQKQLQASLTDVFNKGIKELFEKYPKNLVKIYWTQYTPYFNDGDSCEFGVHEFYVNGKEVYDYGDEDDIVDLDIYTKEEIAAREAWTPNPDVRWDYKNFYTGLSLERQAEFKEAEKATFDFLGLFDEDDYEYMFGDHVEVTITKSGISVDEYSHD